MKQTTNRTVIVLIMMMLTTMTAWANDAVTYIDMDGKTKTVTEYTEVTTDMTANGNGYINWSSGTYVVKSSVTLNGCIRFKQQVIDLIVCDGATLTVNGNELNGAFDGTTLNIYAQSNGTGMGVVNAKKQTKCDHLNIAGGKVTLDDDGVGYGLYVFNGDACGLTVNGGDVTIQNSNGSQGAIYFAGRGFVTLNGGKLTVTNSKGNGYKAIDGRGYNTLNFNGGTAEINGRIELINNINLNGGNVTVNGEIYKKGGYTVTYDFTRATDSYYINAFSNDIYEDATRTVQVKDGVAFLCNGKSYSGTLSDDQIAAISGQTMTPDISAAFSKDSDTEYTIHTAKGWGLFCDALQDNDTYNRFSGKTVKLGNNIGTAQAPITRMAGSGDNPFCGNFDGGGNTLTFTVTTATDNYCAPFRNVKGGSDEDHAITISNLNVKTTITATDYRHMAGLIALQSGHVNVTGINADVTISSTGISNNSHDLYPAGLVSQSNNTGVLTVSGCTTTGQIATDGKYAAGLVGIVQGTASISDCISSVTIQSTTSGDGTHGGLVASQSSGTTITITGCVFDGSLLGSTTNSCGGFIGYRKGTATIYNSLFAPAEVTVQKANSATFARNKVDTYNSYYTYYLCDGTNYAPYDPADADHPDKYNNGHATRTVTAGENVTVEVSPVGSPTSSDGYNGVYSVSGITAYAKGITRTVGDVTTFYYGSGDQLSLTLSNSAGAPDGYRYDTYTASAGTLSGTTLTMPDADVTVSLDTEHLAPIDWATVNQGNITDPYMIYNKDQLNLLAYRVNGTHGETANTYLGKYFKLGADIKFDHAENETDDYAENYEAIGSYHNDTNHYFNGIFDGDGYTVSGIRINKTDGYYTDFNQGLFGSIYLGANIHDVHLTDARITGCLYVGGIAGGVDGGTVTGCTVTDSYITASDEYGTICGYDGGTLTNNYYHGCTVNGTAVTSGVGCGSISDGNGGRIVADVTANNGALPAYHLALGANITTPPGTFVDQTEWLDTPPVDARLAPENGFTLAGNHYFASGYVFTPGSTLASGAAQGYTPRATLGDELLDPYTPTGDNDLLAGTAIARLTITADCDGKTLASTEAIYSTRQPVTVAFINADGTPDEASAIALDGHEAVGEDGDVCLAAGWYFVGKDISYTATLTLGGDVHLILKDGCEMNVGESGAPIKGANAIDGFANGEKTFTIYGQALGTGTLKAYTSGNLIKAIKAAALTVNGGNITASAAGEHATAIYTQGDININRGTVTATATSDESFGIYAFNGTVNINGGTVTANGTENSIYGNAANINGGTITANGGGIYVDGENGDVAINGGNVTASSIYSDSGTIILGWNKPTDRITASSYVVGPTRTVAVADGKALVDTSNGNKYYIGDGNAISASNIANKTLKPGLLLTDNADNSAQVAALVGLETTAILYGRTLYKDGAWNTLCLPFDIYASNIQNTILHSAEIRKLDYGNLYNDNGEIYDSNNPDHNIEHYPYQSGQVDANGTMLIYFEQTNYITANEPHIVKWSGNGNNIINPAFTNVKIKYPENYIEDNSWNNNLSFVSTGNGPVAIPVADKTRLFLGDEDKLYWPNETNHASFPYVTAETASTVALSYDLNDPYITYLTATSDLDAYYYVGPCRAYLRLNNGLTVGSTANAVRGFSLNIEGEEKPLSISPVGERTEAFPREGLDGVWYTLDGRKLSGKPTAPGIYVKDRRKIIVK